MPGMEALVAHLPDVRAGRGAIFGLIILGSFIGATAVMVALDRQWPAWTGLGQIGAIIIGFIWAGQFFWRRRAYRARWGDLAYQKAFKKHILVGLPVIFAAIAHIAYLPGQRLPLGWATPLVLGLGVYLVMTGLVLWGGPSLPSGSTTWPCSTSISRPRVGWWRRPFMASSGTRCTRPLSASAWPSGCDRSRSRN